MIRVLIVEDEPIIRMGILKVIEWDKLGCEVVSVAENGEDALLEVEATQPDLIVSDIKMPKMDGLTMVAQLSKKHPDIKVILLSGYKEFDYAQKAVEYGVSDYILKPVDQDKLEETIKKVAGEILQSQNMISERAALLEKVHSSIPILKDKFIADLLFASPNSIFNIYEKLEYFDISIGEFVLLAITIDSFYDLEQNFTEDDIHVLTFLIIEQADLLKEVFGFSTISFIRDKTVYMIVSQNEETELNMDSIQKYCHQISLNVERNGKFTISIGISNFFSGPLNLRKARTEVDRCLAMCFFMGSNSVIHIRDLQEQKTDVVKLEIDANGYLLAVRNGINILEEGEKISLQIEQSRDSVNIRSIVTEIVMASIRICTDLYGETPELKAYFNEVLLQICSAKTISTLTNIFKQNTIALDKFVKEKMNSRTKHIMDRAFTFINQHSAREISLEEVADYVYMSKWYFSKLFKKEIGINFSEYIMNLRIERAQKIIRENPLLKNYEVAELLGFDNVRYFSQLFKKITGLTPSEFRG